MRSTTSSSTAIQRNRHRTRSSPYVPNNQPIQSLNQPTPIAPIMSSFTHVMVEPCMMRMLEFTSVKDRKSCLCVNHFWSQMVRLPRLWANCRLALGFVRDDWRPLPDWLRTNLLGLSLTVSTSVHLTRISLFTNLQRLSLRLASYVIDAATFRSALESLQLTSFRCVGSTVQAITHLFLPLAEPQEHSHMMDDVQQPPLIHRWTETLEVLDLETDTPESFTMVINGLSQCQWSPLTRLSIRLFTDEMHNYANSHWLLEIKQLLTQQHFPVLQYLCLDGHWGSRFPHQISDESNLIDEDFFKDIPNELHRLVFFDVYLGIEDETVSFPKLYHLPGSLTQLHLHRTDALANISHLVQLRELTLDHYGFISSYEFLSYIGHHHLPLLDTLCVCARIHSHRGENDLTSYQQIEVIRMMNEMTSLTDLDLSDGEALDDSMWLANLNHFINLKRIYFAIQALSDTICDGIAHSNRLEDVSLWLTLAQWSHILALWRARSVPQSSFLSARTSLSPIPIHTLSFSLRNLHPWSRVDSQLISQLHCLTHLTTLSVGELGAMNHHTSDFMKAFAHLSQLTHLILRSRSPQLSSEIISYWTQCVDPQSPPFPRLGILHLSFKSQVSYTQVVKQLAKLPRLHTIQLTSDHTATLAAYARQLNDAGRQPPLRLLFSDSHYRAPRFEMFKDELLH